LSRSPKRLDQSCINHIALVLDASSSMSMHTRELISVADAQVSYLALRSKELDQETRVTVYVFNESVECVVYDKDVLRLPSIKEYYRPSGMTALVDATLLALDDLALTPEKYGDHAFLLFVLTDGQENASRRADRYTVADRLNQLPDHWTPAALVPNARSKFEAKRFGFPADSIAVWDSSSAEGMREVGEKIRVATDSFMQARSMGVRGSRSVFATDAFAVNKQTIQAAALAPLPASSYVLVPVDRESAIKEFVERCGHRYLVGRAYYQLSKTETIQPQKAVAVVETSTGKVYSGAEARGLVGLPDMTVKVKPDYNHDFDIYVQSTSVNRKLVPGTKLLLLL
jgi:hypothetical protein